MSADRGYRLFLTTYVKTDSESRLKAFKRVQAQGEDCSISQQVIYGRGIISALVGITKSIEKAVKHDNLHQHGRGSTLLQNSNDYS